MKIVLVGAFAPYRGGIAHWNMQLADELALRHEVVAINFRRQYPSLLFPGSSQFEENAPPGSAPRIVDSINPLNWLRVGRKVRGMKPDLLIFRYWLPFFGPCFGTIARAARSGKRPRTLFICDNVLPHEPRPFDRLFTRYAFKTAGGFIVQSAAVAKDLKEFWPQAIFRMAPHPVYNRFGARTDSTEARARLGLRARHILLFFGYIRGYKGLDVLLDAVHLMDAALDFQLVVAGEFYDDRSAYDRQIQQLGIGGRVVLFPEYAPTERVRDFFSAADVVVLPYRSATQSGIAQIAYNFDVPVIATDVGGLAEIVQEGKTGYVVPPNDARALAAALTRILGEDIPRDFLPHIVREKQKYSWAHMVQTIEELAADVK
jgi:glycosyltransferase involved in cell wall biosynthesis